MYKKTTYKQFNFYRMKNLRLLLRLSESFTYADLPTKDSETGDETIAGFIPRLHSAMKRAIIAALVIYFIQSIIRTLTTRGLMYNGWYYLDLSASPTFELIQITQVITTFHLLGMFFGPIYLFALLACIGCTQFEKISGFLSEIEKEYMTMDVWARSENQKQLNNCIRLHQDTTKYLSLLEKNVNTMVCGVFLCLLTGLCSTAFSLVMSWGDYTDMSQAVLTYCLYLGLLFCYCRIGTITSEKMINQSFSFFMFLLTMKDKSDGKA
ncbi:uncharacterized protein [Periplaneta americana]|uniref:uncharacterized protein isoform X2 n=1 Tax=Periplaneta americana TaxID=6978 RepID=UPI0037E9BA83